LEAPGTPNDPQRLSPPQEATLEAGTGYSDSQSHVTHAHSEFKGERIDLYTDGSRWASDDVIRHDDHADRPEARPRHPEDLPYGWGQGHNVVGEKPGRSPGDASELPPSGQELVDTESEKSRLREARRELWDDGDDMIDVVQNNVDDVHDIFTPQPTGTYTCSPMPSPGTYVSAQPHSGVDIGTGPAALLVLGLTVERGTNWLREHRRTHSEGDG
jgi:hypothetical protein